MSKQYIRDSVEEFFGAYATPVVLDAFVDYLTEETLTQWIVSDQTGGIHRGPWDEETAREWVDSAIEDGINPDWFSVHEITVFGVPPQKSAPVLEI